MITKIKTIQAFDTMGDYATEDNVGDWCDFLKDELQQYYPGAKISVTCDSRQSSTTLYVECDEDEEGAPTDIDAKNTVRDYINYLWEQWH